MVIFRPHRGMLADAMAESKEFYTVGEMLRYICEEHNYSIPWFQIVSDDIYIKEVPGGDSRVGWNNMFYCMFERRSRIKNLQGLMRYFGIEDNPSLPDDERDTYMVKDHPIGMIGMFSTDYERN